MARMSNASDQTPPRHDGARDLYQVVWATTFTIVVLAGLDAAFRGIGGLQTAEVFVSASLIGFLLVYLFSDEANPRLSVAAGGGLVIGVGVAAVAGLASVIGGWAVLAAVALAATCPAIIRWLRGSGEHHFMAGADRTPHVTDVSIPPSSLDDTQLCRAWHDTGVALGRIQSARALLVVAQYREACLDELVRRFPDQCSAWLERGTPAGMDARTYLPPSIERHRTP